MVNTPELGISRNDNLPNLTDSQFAELGRVIVNWAYFEEYINTALAMSLRLDARQGLALTLPLRSFKQRLDALYGVWEYSDYNLTVSSLKPIYSEASRLYTIRNALAHRAWWIHGEEDIHSFKLDPANLPFHPADLWKLEQLRRASIDIISVMEKLQNFIGENRSLIASLQDRFSKHP